MDASWSLKGSGQKGLHLWTPHASSGADWRLKGCLLALPPSSRRQGAFVSPSKSLPGLNNPELLPYIAGMAKSRVTSPKDLKIRRLPIKKGDEITLRATVTRVDDVTGRVTISVPGALAPITAPLSYLLGEEA